MKFEAGKDVFGELSAGSPFHVYSYGSMFSNRAYAVKAGDALTDSWSTKDFGGDRFHLKVHGPNGFFREFKGTLADAGVHVECAYERHSKKKLTANIALTVVNNTSQQMTVLISDKSYQQKTVIKKISPRTKITVPVDTSKSSGWYDSAVTIQGNTIFEQRFAGRVETGRDSVSDPAMA
jgi:phospholipase C